MFDFITEIMIIWRSDVLIVVIVPLLQLFITVFRSTPKSRPNNMGLVSLRPYVRPQKVFQIPMKFGM